MSGEARVGVLLLNLGTPASPSTGDVRRYLREFLSDPRVLDMNLVARALLLYGVILPFRPRRSAAAYRKVWTAQGSPLLANGRSLTQALAKQLGEGFDVELGMRYGSPSIAEAIVGLAGADRIVVLPLFPQYAASSTGSALERVYAEAGQRWNVGALVVLPSFYDRPAFIGALTAAVRGPLATFNADHLLMSYHGLPERQIRKSDATGRHCLVRDGCCEVVAGANQNCYRAQCYATSRELARELVLPAAFWSVAFQSRLGRTPWIQPFTDEELPRLYERGVRRLAVACPSFVADCLETLEEIGLRARTQWLDLGGEDLLLVPCLNAQPAWVEAIAGWVRDAAAEG